MNLNAIRQLMQDKEVFKLNQDYYRRLKLYEKSDELISISLGLEITRTQTKRKLAEGEVNSEKFNFSFSSKEKPSTKIEGMLLEILNKLAKDLAETIFREYRTIIPYTDLYYVFDFSLVEGTAKFKSYQQFENKHMDFFCWYMSKIYESGVMMVLNNQFKRWLDELYKKS